VRRYKRTLIAPLNWRKVIMKIDGRQYTFFFRDSLQAAQDEVMRANPRTCTGGYLRLLDMMLGRWTLVQTPV